MHLFYTSLNKDQKYFFDLYKSNGEYLESPNFATTLNDGLRGSSLSAEWNTAIAILDQIILLNKIDVECTVYRATTLGIIYQHHTDNLIVYPAFMSTGEDSECVKTHFRNLNTWDIPALLKIYCPAGTAMAPLENEQTSEMEKERLLGRNLKFTIEGQEEVTDRRRMDEIMDRDLSEGFESVYLITLRLE